MKLSYTLIPKQDYPERMREFCPIPLCNVVVKLIIKVIANRIKPLMGKLVGEEQASFIPERKGIDNMITVQEMVFSVRKKVGRNGCLAIKVDLKKSL